MCLILLSWTPESSYPLILLANRDEYHERPSKNAHFWKAEPNKIFAGRDLKSGGTWLGSNEHRRIAAITNYREPERKNLLSRGFLTLNFLKNNLPAEQYLNELNDKHNLYPGFNLILFDQTGLWYATNRMPGQNALYIKSLQQGCYGLCNHLLDTPWPKVIRSREKFQQRIRESDLHEDSMLAIMQDRWQPEEKLLPDTGMGLNYEKLRSPCFISDLHYGTKVTTYLKITHLNKLEWTEQLYDPGGKLSDRFSHSFPAKSKRQVQSET